MLETVKRGTGSGLIVDVSQRFDEDQVALVGVEALDDEHLGIVRRIAGIRGLVDRGADFEVIRRQLSMLEESFLAHFSAEETLMVEAGYPGLEAHAASHQQFIMDWFFLTKKDLLWDGVYDFSGLWTWWTEHVRTLDMAFGRFLNKV